MFKTDDFLFELKFSEESILAILRRSMRDAEYVRSSIT